MPLLLTLMLIGGEAKLTRTASVVKLMIVTLLHEPKAKFHPSRFHSHWRFLRRRMSFDARGSPADYAL